VHADGRMNIEDLLVAHAPLSPGWTFAIGIGFVAAALAAVWFFQRRSHNANLVDPVWSWSLGWLGVFIAAFGAAPVTLRIVLAVLAGLWGFRLGTHLFLRNHRKPEDGRYARFRREWGAHADRNLFWFFQLQTAFAALLALPFVVVAWREDLPPTWAVAAAFNVWIVSVAGEAVADWQLSRFKQDPANRGRVNRTGLWRYSRHPNYFFECLHWFTYLLLAVGSPWWWVGLVSPAVMAFLLLRVSGIPLTEAHMAHDRPEYADYIRTTSAFVPWPPKRPA
jgi:steroid 5-alpha reductase family enzyme